MYGLLIAIVVGLGVFFLYDKASKVALQGGFNGEVQLELINAFIAGEKEILYVDIASKYSVAEVLSDIEMANNQCGDYMGYGLVNSYADGESKDCFVDFEKEVKEKLNKKLKDYGVDRQYDVSFVRDKIIGKTNGVFEVKVGKGVLKK